MWVDRSPLHTQNCITRVLKDAGHDTEPQVAPDTFIRECVCEIYIYKKDTDKITVCVTGGKRINTKCFECSKLTIKCYQPISYYHRKVVWQVSTDGLSWHTKVKSLNPAVIKGRVTFGGVYGP